MDMRTKEVGRLRYWQPKMDNIDPFTKCGKCGKRIPDEKETERILLARRTVGQAALEEHARHHRFDGCVCLGFQFDDPESIRDVETEKGEDALSHDDKGFTVIKRSVGLDPRISRPPWHSDDLATYLVLYSQYPPKQAEAMHALVCKHLRGTEPMGDKARQQMKRLRKRAEEFFSQGFDGPVFVFDAARHSHLLTLKRKGHILRYDSWKFLGKKPRRYKMNLSRKEIGNITSNLEVLIKRFEDSPHEFPFMSRNGFNITFRPTHNGFLSRLRRLSSFRYLVYVCCSLLERNGEKIRRFWKGQGKSKYFADLSIAAIFGFMLLLYSSVSYWYYRVVSRWDPTGWYYHHVISRWAGPQVVAVNHHLMATSGRTEMLVQLLYPLALGAWGIEVLLLLFCFWLLFDVVNRSGNEAELRAERSYNLLTFRFTKRR